MKFSKHYECVYRELPDTWPVFINYKILKKSIRNIVEELENKGFHINNKVVSTSDSNTSNLANLAPSVKANYIIEGPIGELRPTIELSVLSNDEKSIICPGKQQPAEFFTGCEAYKCTESVLESDNDKDHLHNKCSILNKNILNKYFFLKKNRDDVFVTTQNNGNYYVPPKLTRRWTYHPKSTRNEYKSWLIANMEAASSDVNTPKDAIVTPINTALSSDLMTPNNDNVTRDDSQKCSNNTSKFPLPPIAQPTQVMSAHTSTFPPIPALKEVMPPPPINIFTALASCSPPTTNNNRQATSNQVRIVVPLSSNIVVKRPVLLKYLSFDSITCRKVNLKQGYSLDTSEGGESRAKRDLLLEMDLQSDIKFLKELYKAFTEVIKFEENYSTNASKKAHDIIKHIISLSSPYMDDFKHWKFILSLYLDSDIWFYRSGGVKPPELSKESLLKFEGLASNRSKLFRKKESVNAFNEFIKFNSEHLSARLFEEINYTAVRKILKKHDRRTQLQVSSTFMNLLSMSNSSPLDVIRSLTFTIHERFVTVIPLPLNYACPVCQEIYWKPIRLKCNHVFCLRCLVKSQAIEIRNCPLCRSKRAVANASDRNYDKALANFLRLYFPKEVRKKNNKFKKERALEESLALKLSVFRRPFF